METDVRQYVRQFIKCMYSASKKKSDSRLKVNGKLVLNDCAKRSPNRYSGKKADYFPLDEFQTQKRCVITLENGNVSESFSAYVGALDINIHNRAAVIEFHRISNLAT